MSLRIVLSKSEMEPLDYLIEQFKKKPLSISDVAYKLGVDVMTIASILAGSNTSAIFGHILKRRLTEEDLSVICDAYIRAAKKAYKKRLAEKGDSTERSVGEILKSIVFFWKDEPKGFDEEWLREDFYLRLITSSADSGEAPALMFLFRVYVIRIRIALKDYRRRLFSLILSHQYHIFPSEEDESKGEPKKMKLGCSILSLGTVAGLNGETYLSQAWKNINTSFKTYAAVIYPRRIKERSLIYCQLTQLT